MLKEKEIQNYTESELFSEETFEAIYTIEAPHIRSRVKNLLKARAKELGVLTDFKEILKAYDVDEIQQNRNPLKLELTKSGTFKSTIDNFLRIIENDEEIKEKLIYNNFKNVPEYKSDGEVRQWEESDDSSIKRYIEKEYGIASTEKYNEAMRIYLKNHSYNPLRDYIDKIEWDGKHRIEDFLHNWTRCGNSEYTRECSRLLFAGGIARLYSPGCKQEDIITLIGKQGAGKTTLVRWLALQDQYYDDLPVIDDNTAQKLQGIWLCELSELSALKRAKDQETLKAFISRQNDRYRKPYDKITSDHPRQTFFVATGNTRFFLTDVTGNRRFYPIICQCSAKFIYDNKEFIKKEIKQCWAEARVLYLKGELKPFPKYELMGIITQAQDASVVEDWLKNAVLDFVSTRTETCIMEIWHDGLLHAPWEKPKKYESANIAQILEQSGEWERSKYKRFGKYGTQKSWHNTVRSDIDTEAKEFLDQLSTD